MSDKILEQLSALADGELSEREAEMLFARMSKDAELRNAWQDYHLVGDAMRNGLSGSHDAGFADRVMTAVEGIEQPFGKPAVAGRWLERLRPVASLAIAASVAMVAVITLQQPQTTAPAEIVPSGAGNPATVPMLGAQQVDFTDVKSVELQNQLRGYLLNHNEHAASAPMRGLMPYVQIAARDSRPVDVSEDAGQDAEVESDVKEIPQAKARND